MYRAGGKRVLDVVGAALLLLAALPLMGAVAALVWLRLGRPVLFRQARSGRHGVVFELVKFRTMRPGVGPDAARLTPLGRGLRALALDELPQLWLVLRGRMSLVGPRPLPPGYEALYTPREATRLHVRPGLCGLAQSQGRNAVPWAERLEWDARYLGRITLLGDLHIMRRCAAVLLRGQGVGTSPALTASRADPSASP